LEPPTGTKSVSKHPHVSFFLSPYIILIFSQHLLSSFQWSPWISSPLLSSPLNLSLLAGHPSARGSLPPAVGAGLPRDARGPPLLLNVVTFNNAQAIPVSCPVLNGATDRPVPEVHSLVVKCHARSPVRRRRLYYTPSIQLCKVYFVSLLKDQRKHSRH
jgi:hypothetical protein